MFEQLDSALESYGLFLSSENGFDTGAGDSPPESDTDGLAIAFIVVAAVVGVMFAFLGVAYFIRVNTWVKS